MNGHVALTLLQWVSRDAVKPAQWWTGLLAERTPESE